MSLTITNPAIQEAIDWCEAAGLEPRVQHGSLGETSYWVYVRGAYHSYWTEQQFLGWLNAYREGLHHADLESDDDEEA